MPLEIADSTDSAGKGLSLHVNRVHQAIMPLRGKVINSQTHTASKVLSNEECKAIIGLLGTGIGSDFKMKNLKFHYIVLGTDADELTSL